MVKFENVVVSYGSKNVLHGINLDIEPGQLAVLIGPSGCGKTTSLQLINRLLSPSEGRIFVDGKDISTVDPVKLRRSIGYVIQEIGLLPHMTIEENIEIVPKLLGWPLEKRRARTRELITLVGMDESYLGRYPANLSGGQQQRIGLLRALAVEPPIILMDEPFGALDPITRDALQDEIMRLQKQLKKTIIFVTHDMDEAIKIADVIIVMRDGHIAQIASPKELLSNPADEFIEQFIGKHRLYSGTVDTVADVMISNAVCVSPELSLVESVALMQRKRVPSLFVVDDEEVLMGQVTIEEISAAMDNPDATVADVEHISVPSVQPEQSAKEAFDLLMKERVDVLAVLDNSRHIVGVVTRTSIVKSLARVVWRGDEND